MDVKEGQPYHATKLFSADHLTIKQDEDEGTVEAVFSTFGIIDRDGDIVKAGAIPEVDVPIAWSHDWRQPVGRGSITTSRKEAKLTGHFFMSTEAGREAFNTVKEMAELQQWSWGFDVKEWKFEEVDGQEGIRIILDTEPMEVSPVIVGSNPATRTVSVKDWNPPAGYVWMTVDDGGDHVKILVPESLKFEDGDLIKLVSSSESSEADRSGAGDKSESDGDDGEKAGDDVVGLDWTADADLAMAGSKYEREEA